MHCPGDLVLFIRGNTCQPAKYVAGYGLRHQIETRIDGARTLVYATQKELRTGPVHPRLFQRLLDRTKVDENGCWIWQLSLRSDGYGQVSDKHGKPTAAHRQMWFALYGERPWETGHYVCHSCDVRTCISPAHLWKGTPSQNNADRDNKGRNPQKAMMHCHRGHEFTPENTIEHRPGQRSCRKCANAWHRRKRERRRIEEGRPKRAAYLTPEQKLEILRMTALGLSAPTIAARLGIVKNQVYNVIHAKTIRDKKRAKDAARRVQITAHNGGADHG